MGKIGTWDKVQDSESKIVWVNKPGNRRVFLQKGVVSWVVILEKNVGPLGSDDSFIPNGTLFVSPNKKDAFEAAIKYMRRYPNG